MSSPVTAGGSVYVPDHLAVARGGDPLARGQLLDAYRHYMTLLARGQIGRRLQGKADAEDVVQDVFLLADRAFADFRGGTEAELLAWLRTILARHVAGLVRHYFGTDARDVNLEVSLAEELDHSSRQAATLICPGSSPSSAAARRETAVLVADALARLDAADREVLVLRHLDGLSFVEIAARLGTTDSAVRKRWCRALPRLKVALGGPP